MKKIGKFKISKETKNDDEICYLMFPKHPKGLAPGVVKKHLRLVDEIKGYVGPDIILDYDEDNEIIGIEIMI